MSEKGSEPDIEARRFNVAEVPLADIPAPLRCEIVELHVISSRTERGVRLMGCAPHRHVYPDNDSSRLPLLKNAQDLNGRGCPYLGCRPRFGVRRDQAGLRKCCR